MKTQSFLKTFSSSKRDSYGYHGNFMCHSKELHFKLWKLTAYSCVLRQKKEYSVVVFVAKNDIDPRLLDTVPQLGY